MSYRRRSKVTWLCDAGGCGGVRQKVSFPKRFLRDEARHVAFGTAHLRYLLEREPQRRGSLVAAVERRSRMLASISGLNPYVHDSLVVLAGAGNAVAQIRLGADRVRELHQEMDQARRERLQNLGFRLEEATALSAHHTKTSCRWIE